MNMNDAESSVSLEQTLQELLNVSVRAEILCKEAILFCRRNEAQLIEVVISKIIAKSLNDFICIRELIKSGFCLQAGEIAACLLEAGGLVFSMPKTNEAAKNYWDHSDEGSITGLTGKGPTKLAASIGLSADTQASLTEFYKRFCQAKHSNPILLRQFNGKTDSIQFGPEFSQEHFALSCLILHISIGIVLSETRVFLESFTPGDATARRKAEIWQEFTAIGQRISEIVTPHIPPELRDSNWVEESS